MRTLQRKLLKEELAQKCILLEDDKGQGWIDVADGSLYDVLVKDSHLKAEIHEFYLKDKFRKGLLFPDPDSSDGKSFEAFFRLSLNPGSPLIITLTGQKGPNGNEELTIARPT